MGLKADGLERQPQPEGSNVAAALIRRSASLHGANPGESTVSSVDGLQMWPATFYGKFRAPLDTLLVAGGSGAMNPIAPSLKAWLRERAKANSAARVNLHRRICSSRGGAT